MIASILCALALELLAADASVSEPQASSQASPRPIERDRAGTPDTGSGTALRRLATKLERLDQASDADLREIEHAIVETLGIPGSWKVEFARSGNITASVRPTGDATVVTARLSHRRLGGTPMRLSTTLDGGWVIAGSVLFVASDAQTAFERAELELKTGYLEPSTLTPMLEALDRELARGLEPGSTLEGLDPMRGDALAEEPFVRAIVWVREGARHLTAVGTVGLPSGCRRSLPYPAGSQGSSVGDRVIGSPTTRHRLADVLARERLLALALDVEDDVTVSNEPGVDTIELWVTRGASDDRPGPRIRTIELGADIEGPSTGAIFRLGEVPVSAETATAIVRRSGDPADVAAPIVFALMSFPSRTGEPALLVTVTTRQREDFASLSQVSCSIETLSSDGSIAVEPRELAVRSVLHGNALFSHRWTFELEDGRALSLEANEAMLCGVGVPKPRAPTLGDREGRVVGGIARGSIR